MVTPKPSLVCTNNDYIKGNRENLCCIIDISDLDISYVRHIEPSVNFHKKSDMSKSRHIVENMKFHTVIFSLNKCKNSDISVL